MDLNNNWEPGKAFPEIDKMLDKKIVKKINEEAVFHNKKESFAKKIANNKKAASIPVGQDKDLLSSMAQRLSKVEKTCDLQRKEIAEKSVEIGKLKKENESLSSVKAEGLYTELQKCKAHNEKLQMENNDLKSFLNDYGLIWKGKGDITGKLDQEAISQLLCNAQPPYKSNLPNEIDLNVVARRIEELNFIAEKETKVKANSNIHQFEVIFSSEIAATINRIL